MKTRAPAASFLDLHASHHGDTSCYLFGQEERGSERQARFLRYLESEAPAAVGFRRRDLRRESAPPGSARAFHAERFGALSLCLESSYHLSQAGRYLTPGDYRDLGAAVARTAVRWLREADE